MSPIGLVEKWVLEQIADMVFEAIAQSVVQKGIEAHKVKNQLKNSAKKALQPYLEYLEKEKRISDEARQRLVEECLRQLRSYAGQPEMLLRSSLDGQKVLEQLHPKSGRPRNLPEVIREDGLVDEYLSLLPHIADVLCKLATESENWELLSEREILERLDAVGEQQGRAMEAQLATLHGVERIESKVDTLLERQTPATLKEPPSLLLTSLPPRAEHFTGREKELKQLLELLRPGCRATLVAAGGMGKTALASQALHILLGEDEKLRIAELSSHYAALKERFPHGLFYHAFYHQKEADLCLEAICRAFGEQPLPNPEAAASRALAGKRALLVLDGAEETDDLQAVLGVAGGCGVLVTTRRKKDAQGGELIEVKPLPEDKSLRLLRKWAGKYALDEDQGTQSAKEIIYLTGSLPLATTIAGKYLKHRQEPAAEYLKWLKEARLEALSQGDRQKESVPLLLERSLQQVPEEACTLMALSCALAYQPFPIDLLWAGAPELDNETKKRRALDPLLEYGLLVRAAGGLYQVAHLLLYAYGRQRIELENERLLDLARYGVALAKREVPRGPQGFRTLDAYRAHLIWLETRLLGMQGERDEQEEALGLVGQIAWALYDYLQLDGRWAESLESMQAALQAARLAKNQQAVGVWLGNLGLAYYLLGQYEKAIEHHQLALEIAKEVGDQQGESSRLGNLGLAYEALGQYEQAIEHHQLALEIAREIGDQRGEEQYLGNLGIAHENLGQYGKAIEHFQQALGIAQEIDDRRGEGISLGNLGNAYRALGQYQQAVEHYRLALGIAQEIGDRWGEGSRLGNLGLAYRALGRYDKAIEHLQRALRIAQEIGNRRGEGISLGNLGTVYDALGQYEQAIVHTRLALAIAREIGDRKLEGNSLGNLGNAYQSLGQYQKAIEHYQLALGIALEIGDRRGEGNWLGNLGNAYQSLGQYQKAIEHYQKALAIDREIGDIAGEGTVLTNLGLLHDEQGNQRAARQCWQQALKIYEAIGSPYAERVRGLLEESA